MGALFSGSLKATPENINKFKKLLREGNTSKVSKYMKKVIDAIDINQPSVLFSCKCHAEAITLLHYTAARCSSVMVMTVCDVGQGNVNGQATSHGVTPLMYAVIHNNSENILPLHLRKCNLNAKDNHEGNTAFHYACREGYLECVQGLIKAGVDMEQKNKYGNTGLDCAQFNSHHAVVSYIESHGKSSNTGQMSNPLHQQELKETLEKVIEEKLGPAARHTPHEQLNYNLHEGQGYTNDGRRPPSGSSSNVDNGNTQSRLPSPSDTKDDIHRRKAAPLPGSDTGRDVKARTLPPGQGLQMAEVHDGTSPKQRQTFSFDSTESKQRNQSMASSLSNIPDEASTYDSIPFIDGEENENQRGATGGMQPLSLTPDTAYQGNRIQKAIRKKYPNLKDIMKPDRILDRMYALCILDDDEHTKVKQKDAAEKNDFILKKVINGPENLSKQFIGMLKETGQVDVANSIMVKKASSEMNLSRLSYQTYHDITDY